METLNKKTDRNFNIGVLFLAIGLIFIAKNLGLFVPFWIISWKAFILAIGLLIGYSRNFKPGGWIALVIIGGMLTLKSIVPFSFAQFALPMIFIGLGFYMIFKPKHSFEECGYGRRKRKFDFEGFHRDGK